MAKPNATKIEYITIRDVGPITEATVPVVPGVTVVTGANETGKSITVACVQAVTSRGEVRVGMRDGTEKGIIAGLGTTITIGKTTRPKGELDVDTVDVADIAKLVDPGLKDPDAAFKARVRALVSLTGTAVDIADFQALLPDDQQHVIDPAEIPTRDPLELAAIVKRKCEAKAREHEARITTLTANINAKRSTYAELDLTGETDNTKLQAAAFEAATALAALQSRKQLAEDIAASNAEARQQLADLETQTAAGVDLVRKEHERLRVELNSVQVTRTDLVNQVAELEKKIADLTKTKNEAEDTITRADLRITDLDHQLQTLDTQLEQHELRQQQVATLRSRQAAASVAPTAEELAAAELTKQQAEQAVLDGHRIRDGLKAQTEVEALEAENATAAAAAASFREAAAGVDDVLTSAIKTDLLKIRGDEIYLKEGRRLDPFREPRVSEGKRWQVAIAVVAKAMKRTHKLAVIALQQTAWDGLDENNRALVYQAAIENNVCVVTAEKSHGELRAYVWQPTEEGVQ